MKVKELIERLQKQNPDDEIHIWVDDEVGCGAGEFAKYHAEEIKILGHDIYYMDEDRIANFEELSENLYEEYDDISDDEIKTEVENKIKTMPKLEGLWIYIQP
jgi:hypothetical protein